MLGLYDDTYPTRRKVILEPVGDLLGQPFLHLRATGELTTRANLARQECGPLVGVDVSHPTNGSR